VTPSDSLAGESAHVGGCASSIPPYRAAHPAETPGAAMHTRTSLSSFSDPPMRPGSLARSALESHLRNRARWNVYEAARSAVSMPPQSWESRMLGAISWLLPGDAGRRRRRR